MQWKKICITHIYVMYVHCKTKKHSDSLFFVYFAIYIH